MHKTNCVFYKMEKLSSKKMKKYMLTSINKVWSDWLLKWKEKKIYLRVFLESSVESWQMTKKERQKEKNCLKIAFLPLCVPHQLCQEGKPLTVRMREVQLNVTYSAHRLIGSRIIGSTTFCNQISEVLLYLNSTEKRRFIKSLV